MSTQQIKSALNELKSSVSSQVRNIKKDVSGLDTYKSNYDAIMNLPVVKSLIKENKELKKRNRDLEKELLSVLLETRRPVQKKRQLKPLRSCPVFIKSEKIEEQSLQSIEDDDDEVVIIEKNSENIVYEIVEEEQEEHEYEFGFFNKEDEPMKENDDIELEEEVEVEEEQEVEVEVEEEEEVEVEEVELEEEEEEEVEVEVEEEEEEEVEVEVEEEQEVEVEVEEEEEVEVEVEEEVEVEVEVEEEEESGEVYEVTIKGKTYYVMNETDSIIYDVDENGDVSLEVGIYKSGKPIFNKK